MNPTAAVGVRLLSPKGVLTGTGDGDSLENVIPDGLPDGALCYVRSVQTFYALDKSSTATVLIPNVIATARGASVPGRWIAVGSGDSAEAWETLFWVNGKALVNGNGSILTPFNRLESSTDAVGADGAAMQVAIGEYEGFRVTGKTFNIYGISGAQGAPDGNVEIDAIGGTTNAIEATNSHFRLENVALDDDDPSNISLRGTGALFCFNVSFYINDIIQEAGAQYAVEIVSDGLESSDVGNVSAFILVGRNVTFQRPITITGTIAILNQCNPQDDIAFTGLAGQLFVDLFTLNEMRASGVTVTNGTIVVTEMPTREVSLAVPAFGGAGVQRVSISVPGARIGDALAVAIKNGTLTANTMIGTPNITSDNTVEVPIVATAAAGSTTVTLSIAIVAAVTP
jgi:hypothetical protein